MDACVSSHQAYSKPTRALISVECTTRDRTFMRPSHGVSENKGTMAFMSGEKWNKGINIKGIGKQWQFGTMQHKKS